MKMHAPLEYIETPRLTYGTVERIDSILEARMKEFMLTRRRLYWRKFGQ